MEYLNLYDNKGNLLKEKGIRGVKTDKLKGISSIFIENSNGDFLIQKTSKSRNSVYATTGGHVTYGSDFYDTIIREVKEELGVDISGENIIKVHNYISEHYFITLFYLKKDIDINDLKLQKEEVEYVKWLDRKTINELINNNKLREATIDGYKYILNFKEKDENK